MKLDYHIFKAILNGFFGLFISPSTRPTFFDVAQTCPALGRLTQAYPAIRREFEQLTREWGELPQYHDVDPGEKAISATTPKRWNVFVLEVMGHKPERNRAACPRTCAALAQVPNMIQAFFSILEPGKSVPQHEGPYFGYLRYHLGLVIPKQNPPKLVVNAQDYVWKEGEAVLFDDSWPHAVVNNSAEPRAVLIVDIRRPMPLFADLCNRFMVNVVGHHTYGRSVVRKVEQFADAQAAARRATA